MAETCPCQEVSSLPIAGAFFNLSTFSAEYRGLHKTKRTVVEHIASSDTVDSTADSRTNHQTPNPTKLNRAEQIGCGTL